MIAPELVNLKDSIMRLIFSFLLISFAINASDNSGKNQKVDIEPFCSDEEKQVFPDMDFEKWKEDSLGCGDYRHKIFTEKITEVNALNGVSRNCIKKKFGLRNLGRKHGAWYYSTGGGPYCNFENRRITFPDEVPPLTAIVIGFEQDTVSKLDWVMF